MKLIKNRTIKVKLIILLVTAIAGMLFLSTIGILGIKVLKDESEETYQTITIPLSYAGEAQASFNLMKVNLFDAILTDSEKYSVFENNVWEQFELYQTTVVNYYDVINTYDYFDTDAAEIIHEKECVQLLYNHLPDLEELVTEILFYAKNSRTDNALHSMTVKLEALSDILAPAMQDLSLSNVEQSYSASLEAKDLYHDELIYHITLLTIVCAGMIVISVLITRSIANPVREMLDAANNIALGQLDFNLSYQSKDEFGVLADRFRHMAHVLKNLISELNRTANEHDAGNIDARIKTALFEGAYGEMAQKVNDMVASYTYMLEDILDSYKGVSEGNFELIRLKEDYPGKKNKAVTRTNALRENLMAISHEISRIAESASHGELTARAKTDQFKGDWQSILKSMNFLLQSIQTPIEDTVSCLNEIAEGNLNLSIKTGYQGAFNDIALALAQTINSLNDYISVISDTVYEISNNNLSIQITSNFKGDFASIKTGLNNAIQKFNGMITEINAAAAQVNTGASQISETSIKLAEGTAEQTESINSLSNNVQKINTQTRQNAVVSSQANDLSLKSQDSARHSNEEMQNMLDAMRGIKTSTDNIANIIRLIDDIAFQTNILSLNAAVEAARAGEKGKGFGVVAEEVRGLAAKCKNAATETTQLIDNTLSHVSGGMQIARETAQALNVLVNDITEISTLIEQINVASSNQAEAISQAMNSLEQISEITQLNSAFSEESAASAEEFSSQAEMLNALTNTFKTNRTEPLHQGAKLTRVK